MSEELYNSNDFCKLAEEFEELKKENAELSKDKDRLMNLFMERSEYVFDTSANMKIESLTRKCKALEADYAVSNREMLLMQVEIGELKSELARRDEVGAGDQTRSKEKPVRRDLLPWREAVQEEAEKGDRGMSTSEQYNEIVMREKYICSDQDEIGWALGKMQQYAREHGTMMYVIRRNGFYYMTDTYVPSGKRVAIVYPGGRTELGCAYEVKRPADPSLEEDE